MTLLIVFFAISIAASFLCSILEAVILSITPSYVEQEKQKGSHTGKLLQAYKENIDRPLSAILTLNTIAHTVGAIGVGAQAGALFGENYINLGLFSISYESIIASVMTLAILVLSEIIPKTIGANMWRQLAAFTVNSIRILLILLAPFVYLSELITKSLKKDKERSIFSRADFTALARAGFESGALDDKESMIITNLLKLEKLTVRDIMTPRTVIESVEETVTLKDYYNNHKPFAFSRIPIYRDRTDHITGMILKDELLYELAEGKGDKPLSSIKRDILFVKDQATLPSLLDTFVSKRGHMSIVIDDYGSVVGLVSMEDLFETLLGLQIIDESDKVDDLQTYARRQWQERASKHGIHIPEEKKKPEPPLPEDEKT